MWLLFGRSENCYVVWAFKVLFISQLLPTHIHLQGTGQKDERTVKKIYLKFK